MVTSNPLATGGSASLSADCEHFDDFRDNILLTSAARPAGAQRGLIVTTARQNEGTIVIHPRDNPTVAVPFALARNISIWLPVQAIAIVASGTANITDVTALF